LDRHPDAPKYRPDSSSKTTITPYSLRGKDAPYVAAPRWWDEIGPDLRQLTADEVVARLRSDGDPFADG